MAPFLARMFDEGSPLRFVFWDGSSLGPDDQPNVIRLRSRDALTRLFWSPDELGISRGYVSGDIDFEGPLFSSLTALQRGANQAKRLSPFALFSVVSAAVRLGAIRRPPPRPSEELRLAGWRHSQKRDAAAIAHHYDISNDFYRLVLGPSMTYSCAIFEQSKTTLDEAQTAKHDLICRKLGLHERGSHRLLDIGCGWGEMSIHAAAQYGTRVVGVTLSKSQAQKARARVQEAGLEHLVEIRLSDYRDLHGETFDSISSVGMFEHVGKERMSEYFTTVRALLAPQGRLLNHAISAPGGSKQHGRTFVNRYVFPDGELIDIAEVVQAMQRAGFEVRDVESLREHYSQTLHAWVDNLERSWDDAVDLVGEPRARVWRLYMAGSANGFDDGGLSIHQILGVVPTEEGETGMPRTRTEWTTSPVR
jgi:cyclopropane-fatty-acyl-phospholipid synthase